MTTRVSLEDYQRLEQALREWGQKVRPMLISSARQFTKGPKAGFVQRSGKKELPLTNISTKIIRHNGIADGIGFGIQRHGVFVSKGVGSGYVMSGGMVMRVAKTQGDGNTRKPVDWFNPIIDSNVPSIADQVAEIHANLAINAVHMKIK